MLKLLLLFFPLALFANPSKVRALYNSLDTRSIAQHLAFYQLYGDTREGKIALQDAWELMGSTQTQALPSSLFQSLPSLVNKPMGSEPILLQDADLQALEKLAERLPHTQLKGHNAQSEAEVLRLEASDIDLARGLLLSQLEGLEKMRQIRSYEALLDLMALQILARLPSDALPATKIRAMNQFIFDEMGFRFPPHSLYAKEIDLYTFLPSVLDSHRGVCLGVSILYICLAQRLQLPLEMVTPPGHIYVRYRDELQTINIETTARGIHLDSEEYLSVDTRSLKQRSIKEVIGMAHYNQASVYWQKEDFDKAIQAYQKAILYMPEDMQLKELLGYNFLFKGQKQEGERLLKSAADFFPEDAVGKRNIAEDYLEGRADAEAIRTAFMQVDDKRESVLKKKKALEDMLKTHPHFRYGLLQLAIAWLQLHRNGEALEILERIHASDSKDPTVEYYLAELYAERLDYHKAWTHLKNGETLCRERQHHPKALKELRRELAARCPE